MGNCGYSNFEWTLVRRVVGEAWHPADDELAGTEAYGEPVCSTCDGTFSIPFNDMDYTHFYFESGDSEIWLVTTVDSVIGEYYADSPRPLIASSKQCDAYTANWFHRSNAPEDPWVTVENFYPTHSSQAVYAESN